MTETWLKIGTFPRNVNIDGRKKSFKVGDRLKVTECYEIIITDINPIKAKMV